MHLVHNTASVDIGKRFGGLPPGDWLMEDRNAFEVGLLAPRMTVTTRFVPDKIAREPKNILLLRCGALGDLLFLTPCIAPLRAKYPGARITLCCWDSHAELFQGTNLFDGVASYPLPAHRTYEFDAIISLEAKMELADKQHGTDAFAEALGVTVADYSIIYRVSDEERKWVGELAILKGERPKLGIQMRSSTRNRDYPLELWLRVIHEMERKGWSVYLFGLKGQLPEIPAKHRRPDLFDVSQLGLSFRETAAMIEQMDAFCGVDSSLLHLCSALQIPAFGLYAAFDWKNRTSKAPFTRVLTGLGDCAPCNWHSKNGQDFPPHMPCARAGFCSVLASIHPDRIATKLESLRPVHA